jgi:hypothetical protein
MKQAGMAADTAVEISARPVSQEPMVSHHVALRLDCYALNRHFRLLQYLLMNLGQSFNFGKVDTAHIPYPVVMQVDYIRVYQPKDAINYGCDPKDFPTAAYIQQ